MIVTHQTQQKNLLQNAHKNGVKNGSRINWPRLPGGMNMGSAE